MEKINAQIFKDGDDVIVVLKNCDKSIEDFVKSLLTVDTVTEIPSLAPVNEPEIEKPVMLEAKKLLDEKEPEESPVVEETPPIPEEQSAEPFSEPAISESSEAPDEAVPEIVCPVCGKPIVLNESGARCECGFSLGRIIKSRKFSDDELKLIISGGKTDYLDGFVSPSGKPYTASLSLKANKKSLNFEFKK